MKQHGVVIGSGIAGLASAIRLRCKGFEVNVFEKNAYPGGKLSEIKLGKYRFDAGPSLFTMPHFVEELFQLAGKDIRQYLLYKKKEIICNYFFADHTKFNAHADKATFIQDAVRVFNTTEEHLQHYLNRNQLKYESTSYIFLEKSLHKISSYLQKGIGDSLKSLFKLDLFSSLHDVNRSYFQDTKLVQLFDRYATYNGSSPFRTPGIMSMIPHLEQHFGTYFPKGGMISITNALTHLATELGVNFKFNITVEQILVDKNKATGVLVDGQAINADIVMCNMDIFFAYKHLLKEIKAPQRRLNQERSSSALIFYWCIKQSFKELDLHNIFFSSDYKEEFDALFHEKTIADDCTVYINISSKDEPNDAPAGCENWFVMVNAPADYGQDWDSIIERTRKNVIRKLSEHLKVHLESLIECEEILDPRTIERKTLSFRGSLYGTSSNSRYAAFLRHPNFTSQIKNLFFCGGSVHPGGGIPLCLLSAKIATDLIPAKSS